MSYNIVYQSMSVSFANGYCFVITQDGASNCTEFNYRTRREVLEKNWHTTRYCSDKNGLYLVKADELVKCIKQTFLDLSGNDLSYNSSMSYKSRGAFKPYSFWVNHFCNAITRYNVSADKFMDKFKSLSVYVWGAKPDVRLTLHTVDDLYNLFMKYPDKQFSFDIPRDFSVSAFTARTVTEQDRTKPVYYVYNLLDNGIYCRQHRQKQLTVCCFNRQQPYNCKFLNYELEQYLIHNFHIKSVLLFKSIPECVSFFLDREHERVTDVFIGVYGQQNTPSQETKLETYLKKSINYKG